MNLNYHVSLNRDSDWHMHRPHFHEGYEVLLSLSDAGSFFVERNLYPLRRGTLLLMEDAVLHRSIAEPAVVYERYVLHFTGETLAAVSTKQTDLLSRFSRGARCIHLEESRLLSLAALFERCSQTRSGSFGDDLRQDIAFLELLLIICTLLDDKEPVNAPRTADFARVEPILEYIQHNLSDSLTLASIAEKFFISKYHLCHIFKAATGFSVGEYIIHCRVLKARALLRKGCSVQAAGEQAGFRNNAHFIRTFGELSGISPGRYMKAYRKGMSGKAIF